MKSLKSESPRRTILELLSFLKQHKLLAATAFVLMGISSLLNGISIGMFSPILKVLFRTAQASEFNISNSKLQWINDLLQPFIFSVDPLTATKRISMLIVGIYFVKFIFNYTQKISSVMLQEKIVKDIRIKMFHRLLELPLSFFHRTSVGEIISRFINDVTLVRQAFVDGIFVMVAESLNAVVYILLAVIISWKLTLFTLFLVPTSMLLFALIGKKLRKRSTRTQEKMGDIGEHLNESLNGIKIIKIFSAEGSELKKFVERAKLYYRAVLRFEYLSSLGPPLTELFTAIIASIVLVYGAKLIFIEKSLTPDTFFVFLAASLSTMRPLKRLFQANTFIQHGLAATERITGLLKEPSEFEIMSYGKLKFEKLHRSIEFDDVWFMYNGRKQALKGVSFEIKRGENVALVGPSGAGKSTIADMLAGFYLPQKGKLLIDGVDIREYDIREYRKKIAVVPQEPFLFSGTIYENILYARPDASRDEVIKAAQIAAAHDFIVKLPNGYETTVGERGVMLSGGERQRIALARAILRDPEILILDEATSALDSESEELIHQALQKILEGRTTLAIAHRLSTILEADKIVVIDDGQVKDIGRHAELIDRCELYRRLYKLQFEIPVSRARKAGENKTKDNNSV